MTMPRQRQGLLEMLQSLEPAKKTRVLIILTAVIMAIVVYFWFAYFNSILVSLSDVSNGTGAQNAGSGTGSGVSWFSYIYEQGGNAMKAMGNLFRSPRQYIIHGQ